MVSTLSIGTVAKRAGVSVDTVRFYERRGLLPNPRRRASGYRVYEPNVVARIRRIKDLQSLGLSLDEIAEVSRLQEHGAGSCDSQRPRGDALLARIDQQIASLQAKRDRLTRAMQACADGVCVLDATCSPSGAERARAHQR